MNIALEARIAAKKAAEAKVVVEKAKVTEKNPPAPKDQDKAKLTSTRVNKRGANTLAADLSKKKKVDPPPTANHKLGPHFEG